MSGWFSIKHGIRNHPIFKGRPDRLGAWVAMLDEAAYADTEMDVGGVIVKVARGELCASQAMLEEITGLPRQQLRTFLAALEKAGTISTRPATKVTKSRTIVSFCNYEKYQTPQPSINQEPTKHQPTKEQDNKIPTTSGAAAPSKSDEEISVDPVKILFDQGVKFLASRGVKQPQARALIGKWRKLRGDEALLAALGRAQREGAIDPVAFIEGCFRFQSKKSEASGPEIGTTRTLSNGVTKKYLGVGPGWVVCHDYA